MLVFFKSLYNPLIFQVLSANIDHFAQIESLFEDKDFKVKVTRQQLEDLVKELEPRFLQPLIDALKMAELSIDQVLLHII